VFLLASPPAAPQTLPNRNAYAAPRRETAAPARWETLRDSDGRVLRFRRNS
jgi:hypothetical protein